MVLYQGVIDRGNVQVRLPRHRIGDTVVQQVRITVETKMRLRHMAAEHDKSCPALVRDAIEQLFVKYAGGGVRCPGWATRGARYVNQQVRIDRAQRERLHTLAAEMQCNSADLMREAIADLLRTYDPETGSSAGSS